jgi:hypothetical protein
MFLATYTLENQMSKYDDFLFSFLIITFLAIKKPP